jgi:hypothetical protein
MPKRKMFLLAISLTLLIALMGGGAVVWATNASNGEEVPATSPEEKQEQKEVPEVPERIVLRWDDLKMPDDEGPFELTAYSEDAYVGVPPAEIDREAPMVITSVERPQESPQMFRWDEEEFVTDEAPYAERSFELLTYPEDADVKWINMQIPDRAATHGNQDSEKAVEPEGLIPISGTLTPGTEHTYGPWSFSVGDTISVSIAQIPGDSKVSIEIRCMETGRMQHIGSNAVSWTISTTGYYQAIVINHGPQMIVYSGFADI